MTRVLGHLWQIRWFNSYRPRPEGMPEVLAEMYVPVPEPGAGAGRTPEEIAGYPSPQGYSVSVTGIVPPLVPLSPERLARLRRQRLEARERRKRPLFADVFVAEKVAGNPNYYAGLDDRPERDAELARERERFCRVTARPGELVVFWGESATAAC